MLKNKFKIFSMLGITGLLCGCSTTTKLDETHIDEIVAGQKGGAIIKIDSVQVPCSTGNILFKDKATGKAFSSGFAFGMFGTKDNENVIAALPGAYVPVSGNCVSVTQSGGFQYTKKYAFMVSPGSPIVVQAGKLTNPGAIKFTGRNNFQRYTVIDDGADMTAKYQKKYPSLSIVEAK